MTYALSAALQKGVFSTLAGDTDLGAKVGAAIFDAAPGGGAVPDIFVTLGPESASAEADSSGAVATHTFIVSVVSQHAGGFTRAKEAAAAVSDALDGTLPVLERGRVLSLDFQRAQARRPNSGGRRRIDLRFVARVEDA